MIYIFVQKNPKLMFSMKLLRKKYTICKCKIFSVFLFTRDHIFRNFFSILEINFFLPREFQGWQRLMQTSGKIIITYDKIYYFRYPTECINLSYEYLTEYVYFWCFPQFCKLHLFMREKSRSNTNISFMYLFTQIVSQKILRHSVYYEVSRNKNIGFYFFLIMAII